MLSGKQGVARRQRIVEEDEEMTVPGSQWTPEEDGLLRSMGAAGESATAIATLLKRQAAGVHPASSPTRDQVGPFTARAEAEAEMTSPDTKSPDSTTDIVSANPPAARELLS